MNYLQRNRTRSIFKKPIFILVGVFVLSALVFPLLDGLIVSAISPLWKTENVATARLSMLGDYFRTQKSFMEENDYLKSRVETLELEIASRAGSIIDDSNFADLLGREVAGGGVVSTVLVRPPQTSYDIMIIDAGSSDGISVDHQVVMAGGPALGRVSEAYPSSSRVILFTNPGEMTAAVLERHGIPVTLEGIGGGNFRIVLPREVEVELGDRVLSADVSSRLMGVIGDVKMEPTDSFKEVLAKSPASIFNIHFVVVRP